MGMLLDSAKWELTANGKHGCRKTKENMSNQSVKIFAFCLAAPLIKKNILTKNSTFYPPLCVTQNEFSEK